MSEHIVHVAVMEDCFNLMAVSENICPAFKGIIEEHREFGQLASTTMKGDVFTVKLLELYRAIWEDLRPESRIKAKLAFVLGWLSHRAADRIMKPVFRSKDPDCPESPTDCSIYHEAFIYNIYYRDALDNPYLLPLNDSCLRKIPGADSLHVTDTVLLIQALVRRVLMQMHTIIPDETSKDIDAWLDRLFLLKQRFDVDIERIAKAITSPEPDKVNRFITAPNFYDMNEPILNQALRLRRGASVSSAEIKDALRMPHDSLYGRTILKAFQYQQAASRFFTDHSLTSSYLTEALDIGKPGADGLSV